LDIEKNNRRMTEERTIGEITGGKRGKGLQQTAKENIAKFVYKKQHKPKQ